MVEGMTRRLLPVVGVLGLAACSGSPSVIDPKSPQARHISGLWWLMLALATVAYVVVAGLVLVTIARRRRRPPSERQDQRFIVLGGLVVPAIVLAVVGVYTVRTTNALVAGPAAVHVHVAGELWWWRVTYPDLGITTANEIHIPVGEEVEVTLTSENVVHSFWVPQLAGKTDLVPGQVNHQTFTAERPGTYRGQCAEFCGLEHARMAFQVVADEPRAFDQWVEGQRQVPPTPTDAEVGRGQQAFVNGTCAGCHTVAGTSATGTLGPDLTHVASRATLAADTLSNTPHDMTKWLADTQDVKPGAQMPQIDLSSEDLQALVAYLESLR
jgi:cytochrome c oxidase subunit 2